MLQYAMLVYNKFNLDEKIFRNGKQMPREQNGRQHKEAFSFPVVESSLSYGCRYLTR